MRDALMRYYLWLPLLTVPKRSASKKKKVIKENKKALRKKKLN